MFYLQFNELIKEEENMKKIGLESYILDKLNKKDL